MQCKAIQLLTMFPFFSMISLQIPLQGTSNREQTLQIAKNDVHAQGCFSLAYMAPTNGNY